ncbi:MAG TPA: DNA mismatch repair protein MutS, partial [Bdellovibrionota bacterium]|nr:DNA mismatch repair protein MutS [Bdellovibrionota bacterium]
MDRHVKPRSGVEGEAPAALPLEGATRAPMIDTPLMRQYWAIKKQHRDAILFFRLGDFYEMFFEDAEVASKILEIALTSRDKSADNPVPLCGVPYHSANGYISRLLDRGHKVAICEQVEDPKLAKGIVRREVVRVITPGIRTDEEGLSSKEANPLVSVCRDSKSIGLAWMDVSSGHFEATSFDRPDQALEEVERLRPRELLRPEKAKGANSESWLADDRFEKNGVRSELIPEWVYENADRKLCERFGVASVIGFGIPESGPVGGAAYALLYYVEEANRTLLPHLTPPKPYQTNDFVGMDRATVENLEIFRERNANALGKERSLLGILDETETAGGGRMLRDWLHFPLRDLDRIHRRLEAVGQLAERGDIREELRRLLARTHDVERIVGKIAGRRASPRDCAALRATLTHVVSLRDLVASLDAGSFSGLRERLDPHTALRTLLHQSLADEPPLLLKDGDVIRDGFDAGLDELRALTSGGRDWIAQLEATEKKRTGISSLKVGYNRVFGYYIEVTKTHLQKVPEDYIRKQTLAGAERFVTPDLKEKETQILEAEEKLAQVEAELFDRLCRTISESTRSLQSLGAALAELDVYASFARVATQYDYVHPKVTDRDEIRIKAGRHPVVERFSSDPFVPNDILLSAGERQMLILTGPNMAGKSTIMRQVALITLLAHVGSFVPAEAAEIGLVDQIFT